MNATEKILQTYNKEELKEIAYHGCESGVCFKHIYYGDTIKFYEKYEEELIPYFIDQYDVDFLVDLFKESLLGGDLAIYKNNVCWAFIESVAMDAVDDHNFEYAQANADALEPVEELGNKIMAMGLWFSHGGFNLLP